MSKWIGLFTAREDARPPLVRCRSYTLLRLARMGSCRIEQSESKSGCVPKGQYDGSPPRSASIPIVATGHRTHYSQGGFPVALLRTNPWNERSQGCRQDNVCGFQTGPKRVNYWLKSLPVTLIIRTLSFWRCRGEAYPWDLKSRLP